MKKENIKDNLAENGIEDYIVDGCNVSEKLRQNREDMFEAKRQRNAECERAEFWKGCFSITLAFLIMIIVFSISTIATKNDTQEKGLNYCQSQGYSYEYCQRGL